MNTIQIVLSEGRYLYPDSREAQIEYLEQKLAGNHYLLMEEYFFLPSQKVELIPVFGSTPKILNQLQMTLWDDPTIFVSISNLPWLYRFPYLIIVVSDANFEWEIEINRLANDIADNVIYLQINLKPIPIPATVGLCYPDNFLIVDIPMKNTLTSSWTRKVNFFLQRLIK